jgi:hypothetical protein
MPKNKKLKPRRETKEKMHPYTRDAFHSLLKDLAQMGKRSYTSLAIVMQV